jgi:hypothetical protein
VGLLVLAAVFAGTTLVLKHRVESSREVILNSMRSRTGAGFDVGSISLRGLQGLQLTGLKISLDPSGGPQVAIDVPEALVAIDLFDLLSGDITIERIQVDGAHVRVRRRPNEPWFTPGEGTQSGDSGRRGSPPGRTRPFRVVGRDCTFEVVDVAGDADFSLQGIDVDVSRLEDSQEVAARLKGRIGDSEAKQVSMDVRFTSAEDFNVRLRCAEVAAVDVNGYLPAEKRLVETGVIHPTVRVDGYPGRRVVVSVEAPFEDLSVREQPEFLKPADGTLTLVAAYGISSRELTLAVAKVDTPQFEGDAEGTILFSDGDPLIDLRLKMTRLPVQYLVAYALQDRVDGYGDLEFALQEPHEALLTLKGRSTEPDVAARISAAGGNLSFSPGKPNLPKAELQFGRLEASWTPESYGGTFAITDGTVRSTSLGLDAERFSGQVRAEQEQVVLEPLNFLFRGEAFTGSLRYDLNARRGKATLGGTLTGIEETPLATAIKKTMLAGSVTLKSAKASFSREAINVAASIDATQADIAYHWWLHKPPGVGTSGTMEVDILPGRSVQLRAEANTAGSLLDIETNYDRQGSKWRLESSVITTDSLDVVSAAKFLRLPYQITGGTVSEARFAWTRDDSGKYKNFAESRCAIDELAFQAEGSSQPCRLKGVTLESKMNSLLESDSEGLATGRMKVHAEQAEMVSLKEKWFAPLDPDEAILERWPRAPRAWTYVLSATAIQVPPWKGTNFTGEAYTSPTASGFRTYRADVDGGTLEGKYHSMKAENAYDTMASWTEVPAHYLLDHMGFPQVMSGKMNGEVAYSRDRDDPSTLKGVGFFELYDGQFSADFLLSQFQEQLEGGMTALPPSSKIERLRADINFEGDLVKTPKVELESEGIRIDAAGEFVVDGDMDYDLKIAISPETAELIPALKENFNIEGHRLTQQDLELAFKVSGPTLKPRSEIDELPPTHVTITSGVAGVASEAIKVIDTPRKMLVDLLKLGGAIAAKKKKPSGDGEGGEAGGGGAGGE